MVNMTNICDLYFKVTVHVHDELADELGEDLAVFLEESWFNGEDVIEVKYLDHKVRL